MREYICKSCEFYDIGRKFCNKNNTQIAKIRGCSYASRNRFMRPACAAEHIAMRLDPEKAERRRIQKNKEREYQ